MVTTGTIKFVAPTGRYAMISRDDREPKVFVHISEVLAAGETRLEKGQRFEFEVGHDGDGRPSASKLRRI
ncbi:MAG: cold shock domain-containing protein [Brevundimonas sp.]|uniref:cold-shock protein n=1 Tax=Brevundimonas sp. TaxID=1871086 RepID=UPI0027EB61C0|nr:cold shock domain-containing protein [Brevundimonas sp.]MDI6624612.1 cold shock domain-containing protein [Brevundimonas sp.]MDQ7812991.1 cold shock domain-containing protein [Brevundimonas sp.]